MHLLPTIALLALGTLYGLAWHNQPARNLVRRATEPEALVTSSIKSSRPNWRSLATWRLMPISCAALFVSGYVIWAKCRGA